MTMEQEQKLTGETNARDYVVVSDIKTVEL